ncbi:MAG: altronate dehydratase family protein [Verrucomicrobiales bacterium]|nr:altronate dehydratase family protein [Verrucomicrobiales bacterium]
MSRALLIDPRDNLAVALQTISRGSSISVNGITVEVIEEIPVKHKFATEFFEEGHRAIQYGVTVGVASRPIEKGGLITTENLNFAADGYSVGGQSDEKPEWKGPDVSDLRSTTFQGIRRSDGSVGTANHWLVIPLVFCETRNIEAMKNAFEKALGYGRTSHYEAFVKDLAACHRDGKSLDSAVCGDSSEKMGRSDLFPHVDGIKFLNHQMGCGGTRDDSRALCSLLAGYITHPNVAGATVLSLGCENAQAEDLLEEIHRRTPNFSKPLHILKQQEFPGEKALLESAIRKTFSGLIEANSVKRESFPLSELCIGVECGGSDGFSGISANPVIGHLADLVVALGGKVILSEFPELCGVEQELIERCVSIEVANRFADITGRYARRAEAVGSHFSQNPSPGNIRDGLITDAIKSAGAAKKGGTSPVVDALDYPEKVTKPGLNLLCTPGNDVESTTGLAGAHANLILFSTGLGTPTGNPVCPVIKISSNTDLATRLSDIIDFDTGGVIDGSASIEQLAEDLLDLSIEVASGRILSKAQELGQDDFIPWKRGVSL